MVNEYMITAYLDDDCQIEAMSFRQMGLGPVGSIVKRVEQMYNEWQVIILTPLWDDTNPQGNYWTRKQVYPV